MPSYRTNRCKECQISGDKFRRGLCSTCYMRVWRDGKGRFAEKYPVLTLEDKFLSKVVAHSWTSCWLWTGARNSYGYGNIRVNKIHKNAHRVSYELAFGPPPAGLDLDHLCNNKWCVNPLHLEPVTRSENLKRGHQRIAQRILCEKCGGPVASWVRSYEDITGYKHPLTTRDW